MRTHLDKKIIQRKTNRWGHRRILQFNPNLYYAHNDHEIYVCTYIPTYVHTNVYKLSRYVNYKINREFSDTVSRGGCVYRVVLNLRTTSVTTRDFIHRQTCISSPFSIKNKHLTNFWTLCKWLDCWKFTNDDGKRVCCNKRANSTIRTRAKLLIATDVHISNK